MGEGLELVSGVVVVVSFVGKKKGSSVVVGDVEVDVDVDVDGFVFVNLNVGGPEDELKPGHFSEDVELLVLDTWAWEGGDDVMSTRTRHSWTWSVVEMGVDGAVDGGVGVEGVVFELELELGFVVVVVIDVVS
ncbi:hypothetical protein N7454_005278 [Penicillium verhagenii]|nr:hypothetical protein N7454_005278 [Penicillium verhagenii]